MSRTKITAENLSKSYGSIQAIKDINLSVREGEIFGLIGPDGAGKTTLFRILTSLLLPDKGSATINTSPLHGGARGGLDIVKDYKQLRTVIGYMPGRFSLYQDLTVEENLEFFASVFGTSIRKKYDLIAPIYVQIEPFKNRRAGALSGGMKQKLALCCALIHKPEVLFLDEPTTGVDPVSRKEFWDMLRNLKTQGLTMLVSTPYMDEAELCDRVALIQKGEIMAIDTPEGITASFQQPLYAVRSDNMYQLITDLRAFEGADDCYAFGEYAHLKLSQLSESLQLSESSIQDFLLSKNHRNIEVKSAEPTVEDCFIELMKN